MARVPVPALVFLLVATPVVAQQPSPTDLDWLRGEVGDGALAYWVRDAGKVFLTELASGDTVEVGTGGYPEFSPDGSKLAWIDGTTARGRMRKGDATVHVIAEGVTADAGIHWVSDSEVVLVRSGTWRRVSLSGAQNEVPALTALGLGGTETDVKLCPDGTWAYVNGTTWRLSTGQSGATGGSCSCSLAPGGDSVTGLEHGHKSCQLTRIRPGGHDGALGWVYDYDGDKGFDNHRYASNHADFVACQDEKYDTMVIMKVGDTYCTRMGEPGSGEMYGDFTVGDGAGDPWPGTAEDPVLLLDPASLSFAGIVGGADPAARTVAVINAGEGTLDEVGLSGAPGWLTVLRVGSGNQQVLDNQVSLAGLAAGDYRAEVEVACSNAVNAPCSYSVSLDVRTEPALTSIELRPVSTTVVEGQTAVFTASPRDQNGEAFPAAIDWSVSGGGGMDPSTSDGPVTEHVSTFASDGSAGSFTVSASCGGVEGRATVTVEPRAAFHLRINCGENGFTPDGWEHDDGYVEGGTDFVFPEVFDTAGVAHAAPPGVYKTCRHRIRDVEDRVGYQVASLPDGDYTVRLHFGDAYGPRSIDVWMEGTEVLRDLDIATAAGGTYRALVEEIQVTVGGGDGLQITLTDDRDQPADFFVNGIEILGEGAGENQAPRVDAGADQVVGPGVPVFLDGSVSDDGLPSGTLEVAWSKLDGPGAVDFIDPADPATTASIDRAGIYLLRLEADDGELVARDEVQITVTGEPSITILSPEAADVLLVGTEHVIRWSAANLDDVQIDYSVDDGDTWSNIVGSVDTRDPAWGAYAWTVPDEPTEQGRILITGYYGDAPTRSGVFAIRRRAPDDGGGRTDEDDPSGGDADGGSIGGSCACGASRAPAIPLFILVLLLMGPRRGRRPGI